MNILVVVAVLSIAVIPIHALESLQPFQSFQTYDQDGDGVVTFKELSRVLLQRKSMETNSQPNQRKQIQDKYTVVEMTAIGMGIHEKPFDTKRFRQLMEKKESTPMDVLESYPDVLVDEDRLEDEIRNSVLNAPIFKDLNEPSREEEEAVTRRNTKRRKPNQL